VDAVRRTKLVCTLGPASVGHVGDLVATGMDVARVNFSHGTQAEHEAMVAAVRDASAAAGRPIGVMVDLAGPKIRLGPLAGDAVDLQAGSRFMLRPGWAGAGGPDGASVSDDHLAADVRVGDRILLADGAAELRVTATGETVETVVVRGGSIRSRAGVAVPTERRSGPALTEKDLADLPRASALGADFVAQSFIRGPEDVAALRRHLGERGPAMVAKIETRPAVDNFGAILDLVDGVMIARGDLGVEVPFEEVPLIQKQLLRIALDRGVPSIVATQMLESMTSSPRPTRAEASDVANAVFDGADAIMLSAETAIGAFPVEAAEAAVSIARVCEAQGYAFLPSGVSKQPVGGSGALAVAAVALANADPGIAGIACYTRTGRTAAMLSSLRPPVPVFAFASDVAVARRLALTSGVVPAACPQPPGEKDRLEFLVGLLADRGLVRTGAPVVLVASTGQPGTGPGVLAVQLVPDRGSSTH
jgi:pyruvate kinase